MKEFSVFTLIIGFMKPKIIWYVPDKSGVHSLEITVFVGVFVSDLSTLSVKGILVI